MELTKVERYYQNNQLKDRFYYDDINQYQGLYERYKEDGSLAKKGVIEDNFFVGLWNFNNTDFKYFL